MSYGEGFYQSVTEGSDFVLLVILTLIDTHTNPKFNCLSWSLRVDSNIARGWSLVSQVQCDWNAAFTKGMMNPSCLYQPSVPVMQLKNRLAVSVSGSCRLKVRIGWRYEGDSANLQQLDRCMIGASCHISPRVDLRVNRLRSAATTSLSVHKKRMANSRYEYVKSFELDDALLPGCYIVIRIDGKGFTK